MTDNEKAATFIGWKPEGPPVTKRVAESPPLFRTERRPTWPTRATT